MKKKIIFALPIAIITPLFVFAESYSNVVGCGIQTIPQFIKSVLSIVIKIGIPIASVFIIYAGFLFITAQGNESKVTAAKKALLWSCIGFGVLLASWIFAIAAEGFITSFSGGQGQSASIGPC